MSYVYLYILFHANAVFMASLCYPVLPCRATKDEYQNPFITNRYKFSISRYELVYLSHHLWAARNDDAAHESTLIIRRAAANIRAAIHRLRIDATPVGQLELKA